MTDVEKLIKEKEEAISVVFHRFILLKDTYSDAFFYFVEGKDAPYYTYRVRTIVNSKDCIPIKCGNKEKTIKIHKILSSNPLYDKYKKAYFVDKDFDDNSKLSLDIYVTPCYSIENLYSTEKVLSEILKCEFDILPSDREYSSILQLFHKEQSKFHNATILFNAWYACIKSKNMPIGVCLDEKFPKKFLTLKINNITYSYDIESIKSKYTEAPIISNNEIEIMKERLKSDLCFNLRGKYEIQFFYEFIKYLINDANEKGKQVYVKEKTKLNLDKAQILSQLSQYAITPECLMHYIQQRFMN
ncbi:DUF4435 domain-containing protein [Parabacteroides distasonis]|uniref:DUF4435 domain-containing protein n=1 Tax=Parabacteroides distasonis TaxID=823 RepID=UPI00189CC10F|nr:DUF4435 domain-containing protein [Parabacteroides distasonis]MDB9153270.1 DUF4435 domain-containing protein [Parabacteroides distasonis]MDB9157841.1 DUF4435 domain-containing protein [Parabacteroides distasonis]MDB9166706.1 DUF4435 domain-containing protein [Parabacteroides distasonis]MDB9171126.1 DUF4435 domain-containing protein [Parabacteroides distasonis]MDB9195258.1 DUF4435 domain-containing protein [Parabacteroides distasonis]